MVVYRTLSINYLYFAVPERPRNHFALIDKSKTYSHYNHITKREIILWWTAATRFQRNLQFYLGRLEF